MFRLTLRLKPRRTAGTTPNAPERAWIAPRDRGGSPLDSEGDICRWEDEGGAGYPPFTGGLSGMPSVAR